MTKISKQLQDEYHIQQLLNRILPSASADCFVMCKGDDRGDGHIQNESGSIKIPLNMVQVSFLISKGYVGESQAHGKRLRNGMMERYTRRFTNAGLRIIGMSCLLVSKKVMPFNEAQARFRIHLTRSAAL